MHTVSRQFTILGVSVLSGMLIVSGCASKKYAREQAGAVDTKLTTKVNEVDGRVKVNAEKIDAVDARARQGISDAAGARGAAAAADTKATQAGTAAGAAQTTATSAQTAATGAQQTATQANQGVAAANTRISTVENRVNNIDKFTAGPPANVMFKAGSATLDAAAKMALDGVVGQVSGLTSGFLVEIQGFASSDGGEAANLALSERRAEAVFRYLISKNVPQFRINKLGLGVDRPVGDNKTRAGREQNRRVEVRVLKAG
jgi:outer membrane protein OmpA-like peptidoglycan-associated protein